MSEILWIIIVIILLAYLWLNKSRKRHTNLPPGPKNKFIFGELFTLKPRLFFGFDRISKQYGEVAFFKIFTTPVVVLSSLKAVKDAFFKKEISGRLESYFVQKATHGSGIIFTHGKIWRTHRNLSLKILRDFGVGKPLLEEAIRNEARDLCEHIESQSNQFVNTNQMFSIATGNIICALVFGERPGYKEQSEFIKMLEYIKTATQGTSIVVAFLTPPRWIEQLVLKLNFMPTLKRILNRIDKLHEFVIEKIEEHRQNFVETDEPSDFIYAYLREQQQSIANGDTSFDDWKIIRVTVELFVAGTDTTATQLNWLTLLLALHDDVRKKAFEEIRQNCGLERIVKMDDKRKLNYTQALLDECMRYAVITPTGALPHRAMEDTEILGYTIPKNTMIFLNHYSMCRDSKVWKYPNTFNPENFLDENGQYQPSEHLIPFSIGKRACLGEGLARMELFIFTVTLLQRFQFELEPVANEEEMKEIMMGSEGGIRAPGAHQIRFKPV